MADTTLAQSKCATVHSQRSKVRPSKRFTIETPNLTIRAASRSDLTEIIALLRNKRIAPDLGVEGYTAGEIRFELSGGESNFQKVLDVPSHLVLAVIHEDKVVGYVRLRQQDEGYERFDDIDFRTKKFSAIWYELSYAIDPAYWGRGFASEAVKFSSEYFLNNSEVRWDGIHAVTQKNNLASQGVLRRAGYEAIGSRDGMYHAILQAPEVRE